MVRFINVLLFSVFVLFANVSFAAEKFVEGKDYTTLAANVGFGDASKSQVVEYFSYACIWCFRFEPIFKAWKEKQKAANLDVDYVPVVFNNPQDESFETLLARAYYTQELLGIKNQAHQTLYDEIYVKKKYPKSAEDVAKIHEQFSIKTEQFVATMQSFPISQKVKQAFNFTKKASITGTPSVVVNNKYLTSPAMAGGMDKALKVIEYLLTLDAPAG